MKINDRGKPISLSPRRAEILHAVIELYAQDQQPVGSKTLRQKKHFGYSAATLRHEMASLEELGLLSAPHHSAGRIPTERGYRHYLQTSHVLNRNLIEEPVWHQFDQHIHHICCQQQRLNVFQWVDQITNLISQFSACATLLRLERSVQPLLSLECILLSPHKALLIFVFKQHVHHCWLAFPQPMCSDMLMSWTKKINDHCSHKDLREVRLYFCQMLAETKGLAKTFLQGLLHAVNDFCLPQEELSVAGQMHLIDILLHNDSRESLYSVLSFFNQRQCLLDFLDQLGTLDEIRIFVGKESGLELMQAFSIILVPFKPTNSITGTLGLVGPTSMPYHRMIDMVQKTATILNNRLGCDASLSW